MATFLRAQPLGLYVSAVAWSGAATPLFNAVGIVLFPHISSIKDESRRGQVLWSILPRLFLVSTVSTLFMMIITPMALPLLFGSSFGAAIPAAIILLFANGFGHLNYTLTAALQGMGMPGKVLFAEMIGLAITGGALLILLPPLGIVGAALASLFAYAAVTWVWFGMIPPRAPVHTESPA